jgi:hypothetical protein
MPNIRLIPMAGVVTLLLGIALTGCVTSKKYKMAKKEGAVPPKALNWSASSISADVTLQSLIVFKGPGSWKREARWDEYVVTFSNHGAHPLRIGPVELIDVLGQPQSPGTDPWKLEKLSYTNWDKYGKTGLKLLAGAGAVTLYAGAVVASTMGGLMAPTAAAGGGMALLNIIPVVAIVDITAVAIMNSQNKKKVVAEFNGRRLPLPLTIAAGETASGSLFFPMTPAPQRLVVKGADGELQFELSLELKPLAALHLKPASGKKTTAP